MGLLSSTFHANLQARAIPIIKTNFKKLWKKKKNVLHKGMQGYYSKHWNFRKTLQIDQSNPVSQYLFICAVAIAI